jgi:hypothetical protein
MRISIICLGASLAERDASRLRFLQYKGVFKMSNRTVLSKILVIAGTLLVLAPILFMLITSISRIFSRQPFQIDYFIPMELFYVNFPGALLLFWASWRMRTFRTWTSVLLGAVVVFLLGTFAFVTLTGLASGDVEPTGWLLFIGDTLMILYSLSYLLMGIIGIILIARLFARKQAAPV